MTKTKTKKRRVHPDVGALTDTMLVNERGQNEITMGLSLGLAGRRMLESRNEEIRLELERRAKLDKEALERENYRRIHIDPWKGARIGTMVTRSTHWHQQHPGWPAQYGVITKFEAYEENGFLLTYLLVWWEGDTTPSLTHPDNASIANTAWHQNQY